MIIIINGTPAVGKSSTSWALAARFERAMMLDGDYIGAVHPFEIYDDGRIEHLYQTLRHLIAFHQTYDYHNFVINYVFESPQSLARLKELLFGLDPDIHAFRLHCDQAEIKRRILQRNQGQDQDGVRWELNRYHELTAIFEAAEQRGDIGRLIDTTRLSLPQVVETIWQLAHRPE